MVVRLVQSRQAAQATCAALVIPRGLLENKSQVHPSATTYVWSVTLKQDYTPSTIEF
jgi:hypothetical protein